MHAVSGGTKTSGEQANALQKLQIQTCEFGLAHFPDMTLTGDDHEIFRSWAPRGASLATRMMVSV